jgi:glycopeptide antibiotics resistance protein
MKIIHICFGKYFEIQLFNVIVIVVIPEMYGFQKNKKSESSRILTKVGFGLFLWCHFQQYFSYIVAVSFIGGGPGENHCESLTNLIT